MKSSLLFFIATFAIPTIGEDNEIFTVPSGYNVQNLEPTGGKIAMPEGWHYSQLHVGPKYKWIISKEDPEEGPYWTGVMLQMFIGVEKRAGKTPEEFCKSYLAARASATRKVYRSQEATDSGMFKRAEIEVEELVVHSGEQQLHRVAYSVFWMEEGDFAIFMSAGCPSLDWDRQKEHLDVMGRLKLINKAQLKRNGKSHPTPPEPLAPSSEVILNTITKLINTPASAIATDQARLISIYAQNSSDVSVDINVEYLPWITKGLRIWNSEILVAAFVGGNLVPQLQKNIKEDHAMQGVQTMLAVYRRLRISKDIPEIPQFEGWSKLSPKELKDALVKIEARAHPLNSN